MIQVGQPLGDHAKPENHGEVVEAAEKEEEAVLSSMASELLDFLVAFYDFGLYGSYWV